MTSQNEIDQMALMAQQQQQAEYMAAVAQQAQMNNAAAMEQRRLSALMPEHPVKTALSKNPDRLYNNFLDADRRTELPATMHSALNDQLRTFADDEFFEVLKENVGNAGNGINVVRRMSVMAGGAPMFQEPRSPEGHTGPTHTELIAVIPHMQQTRRMFKNAYGTAGADRIPDCTSVNVSRDRKCDMGFGNPGGECNGCEHDTFVEGIGRACAERQALFVLCDGQPFPHYIDLSVYSQRPIQSYMTSLIAQQLKYWQVVHKIKLANTNSRSGQSIAIFSAEPIGIIDATDPMVCKGLNNLQKLSQMVLRDFATLVENSKSIRLTQANPDRLQSLQETSSNNLPLPPSMAAAPANAGYVGNLPAPSALPAPGIVQQEPRVDVMPTVVANPMDALAGASSNPYLGEAGASPEWNSMDPNIIESQLATPQEENVHVDGDPMTNGKF